MCDECCQNSLAKAPRWRLRKLRFSVDGVSTIICQYPQTQFWLIHPLLPIRRSGPSDRCLGRLAKCFALLPAARTKRKEQSELAQIPLWTTRKGFCPSQWPSPERSFTGAGLLFPLPPKYVHVWGQPNYKTNLNILPCVQPHRMNG